MHLKSDEFSNQNPMEIVQRVVFSDWNCKKGAPKVIEGAESIFEVNFAILTLKISFSTTNNVVGFQPNLPKKVQMV